MRVALVNTNRIRPPIAPIGLEYIAEFLHASGHDVEILDLCWAENEDEAIGHFFAGNQFGLVGATLRNTDDCAFTSRQSFLREFSATVQKIRQHTDAFIVLGGVGFSVMPELVLSICDADAGIWSDGEWALCELANRLERGEDWRDVPNLVWKCDGRWHRNSPFEFSLNDLPTMHRSWVDNKRYFKEGGQAGFEAKRGCNGSCIYCADPVAKGRNIRLRPPSAVADEVEHLVAQGIDHLHTCDSEFNLPPEHAIAVCDEFERRKLGDKVRWYAYCSPVPFSHELAKKMRRAGCVGINFGVDSGDEEMLRRLGRSFTPSDIKETVRICRQEGIAVMLDLLLGAPGETKESLKRTIETVKQAEPDCVGVAVGVRVYPCTPLAKWLESLPEKNGLIYGNDPVDPVFFLEPNVAPFIFEFLDQLIGGDQRFFFFDPSRPERDYNYNANERLIEAIQGGYRGAYWDILRRFTGGESKSLRKCA